MKRTNVRFAVYFIFDKAKLAYIGQSISPYGRLRHWRRKRCNDKLTIAIVAWYDTQDAAIQEERFLIRRHKPAWNRTDAYQAGLIGRSCSRKKWSPKK